MLTGNSEPQQNRAFLQTFGTLNNHLKTPFRWIEMQTTGVNIDDQYLRFLRNHVGVSTISLSVSSLDDAINKKYIGAIPSVYKNIEDICGSIKKYDFNLRLSINLTDAFNDYTPERFFTEAKALGANQVTFRVLYSANLETPQDKWLEEHAAKKSLIDEISNYVEIHGRKLERLEFGAMKYSVNEMSVVIDIDSMSIEEKDVAKYLILRENCKLYTKWDDDGSLVF